MELDSENVRNNIENPGMILRKRKKLCYVDRVIKRRTNNSRTNRNKRKTRRHRSLDSPKINALSTDAYVPRPTTSTGSLESVIYLGYYRKVPQLITLDENNVSVENQGQDQEQNLFAGDLNVTSSTYSSKKDAKKITSNQVTNDLWNETQDTNNLLNLLSEMCVGATYKGIVTRAMRRECKN